MRKWSLPVIIIAESIKPLRIVITMPPRAALGYARGMAWCAYGRYQAAICARRKRIMLRESLPAAQLGILRHGVTTSAY